MKHWVADHESLEVAVDELKVSLIEGHQSDIAVRDLAKRHGINKFALNSRFRERFGRTPGAFIEFVPEQMRKRSRARTIAIRWSKIHATDMEGNASGWVFPGSRDVAAPGSIVGLDGREWALISVEDHEDGPVVRAVPVAGHVPGTGSCFSTFIVHDLSAIAGQDYAAACRTIKASILADDPIYS